MTMACSIFFSNTILPIETLPLRLKEFILYNPFVVSESLIKRVLIFGFSAENVIASLARLFWYNVILVLICYLSLKYSRIAIRK